MAWHSAAIKYILRSWFLIGHIIEQIISNWGYIGVFLLVGAESCGIPAPGESALIAASVAAAKGDLSIALLLGVASAGGIIGDNIGFWVGRGLGFRLLCRYGSYIGMPPRRMKLLQYLFLRYGRRIVFVGRFVMILRAWEAFLAGADWMPWQSFATTNAAAVVTWACLWGLSAYLLGHTDVRIIEWVSAGVTAVLIILTVGFSVYFHRHEDELEKEVDQALPGPLRPRRHKARAQD